MDHYSHDEDCHVSCLSRPLHIFQSETLEGWGYDTESGTLSNKPHITEKESSGINTS